jgi:ubiquinone/menaquinone biosynthesis C-methylase UbiE
MAERVHNPVFAHLYSWTSGRWQGDDVIRHRRELLAGLRGRVLELGAGDGINFSLYPTEVTELVAVEPEPYLHAKATLAAARAPVPVRVVNATADQLPVEDASFTAAVASLVLCSVPNQSRALEELRRILRPGGELRFYEHVLSENPKVAHTQRVVDRLFWPRVFGGCHTARDTPAALEAAGFSIEKQRNVIVGPRFAAPVRLHVLGSARKALASGPRPVMPDPPATTSTVSMTDPPR